MAQLFRVVKLPDSAETRNFTFVLPEVTGKDLPPEIVSRDFMAGGQKWRLSLVKRDKHLSPYLRLVSASECVTVLVDYSFTLVNRETFTKNETYQEKQREFRSDKATHGHRTFVTLDEMSGRNFVDLRSGDCLFEVSLGNIQSTFAQDLVLSNPVKDQKNVDQLDYQRYDTRNFWYGDLEWTGVFCPNMDFLENKVPRHMIQINRVTKSDCLCKLRYRLTVGSGPKAVKSEWREEIFDFSGNGEGFYFTADYISLANHQNLLALRMELSSLVYLNQIKLNVLSETKNKTNLYDKDRQAWSLQGNAQGQNLQFTLTYTDVFNIPNNYLRFVSWGLTVVPARNTSNAAKITGTAAIGSPFRQYYGPVDTDSGYRMETKISSAELRTPGNYWLDEDDQRLTVLLEWYESYLLCNSFYHVYDDIVKRHMIQMRREVRALQSENTSLEKELHHYQISIANKSNLSDTERHSNATTPMSLGPSSLTPRRQSIEPLELNGKKPSAAPTAGSLESKRSATSESTNSYGPSAPSKSRGKPNSARDEPVVVQTELICRPASRPHSSNSGRRLEENGRYDRDVVTPTGLPVRSHMVDSRTIENSEFHRPHSPRAISAGEQKVPRGPAVVESAYQQEFISKERMSSSRGRTVDGRSRYHQSNGAYREPTAIRHVKVDQSQRHPHPQDYYDPTDIAVAPEGLQRPYANPIVGHSPTRNHSREQLRQDYSGSYSHR